jgi:knotted carbamoyltransferase YgeW
MVHEDIRESIEALSTLDPDLLDRDFLLTWRHGDAAVRFALLAAEILEGLVREGASARVFEAGIGMAIFRDKSTRTRYAFKAACNLLGLSTEELDEATAQVAHGETVRETAAMIGFLTEVVGIRDDMFPGEGHWYMTEVAASFDEAHRGGALLGRPSVLNLQSDLDHPTQSLSDLLHLARIFGGLGGLRGKRLAVSWAYSPSYAKPLSVPQGLVALMTRFGMDVVLAHPPGYELMEEPLAAGRRFAAASGGSLEIVGSMEEAFAGADVVYPKSWAPAGAMRERTHLLRTGEADRIAELEQEALAENARFRSWECDEARMKLTKGGKALYMHCLPADVTGLSCASGEVSQAVFERARIETYRQAGHKPFIIAALILATRLHHPAAALRRLLDAGDRRRRA